MNFTLSLIVSQQRALMLCHKPAYENLEVSNCEVSWRATAEVSTVHAPLFLSEVWWGKVTTTKKSVQMQCLLRMEKHVACT